MESKRKIVLWFMMQLATFLLLAVFPECVQVSVFHLKPTSFIFSGILRAVAMGIDLSVSRWSAEK